MHGDISHNSSDVSHLSPFSGMIGCPGHGFLTVESRGIRKQGSLPCLLKSHSGLTYSHSVLFLLAKHLLSIYYRFDSSQALQHLQQCNEVDTIIIPFYIDR